MKKSTLFVTFIACCHMSTCLGTSSSSSSNDYIVSPPDKNPSMGYDDGSKSLVSLMKNLTSQGYTDIWYGNDRWWDKTLYGKSKSYYIGQKFGYYKSNGDFVPANKKPTSKDSRLITGGVYKLNKNALVKAIGKGKFVNKVLLNRLLVEEFFFGQLLVSAGPFCTKSNSLSSNKVLSKGVSSWQTTLTRLRFIRNAIEATSSSSGTFTIGQNPSFSPVDFFVGIILVNNSSLVFQKGSIGIKPGGVGFFPIDSSAMMNKWSSVYTSDSTALPTRQPMQFGTMGGTQHSFNLQVLPENTVGINLAGINYIPSTSSSSASSTKRHFSKTKMQKFFKDVGPWALVVEVDKTPEVKGLAKMSFADFGQYLQIKDSKGTYNFSTIFDAVFDAYLSSYLIAKNKKTERVRISSSYPADNWFTQALLNGILESSTYQNLADSSTNKPIPFDNVVLNEWRKEPSNAQILGYGSGHDFLFLRALRVTKALLYMSGISLNLINTNDSKNNSLFLQALAQPTKNIAYHGKTVYIGGSNSKRSNAYMPILPVLPSQAPKATSKQAPKTISAASATAPPSTSKGSTVVTKSVPKTISATSTTAPTSTSKGFLKSSPSSHASGAAVSVPKLVNKKSPKTTSTAPVTVPTSTSKGSTATTGLSVSSHRSTGLESTSKTPIQKGFIVSQKRPANEEGQSSNASINAYKKGYRAGQATAAYKQGYKKGMQSSSVNNY